MRITGVMNTFPIGIRDMNYQEYEQQLEYYKGKDPSELITMIKMLGHQLDTKLEKIINTLDKVLEDERL